MSENPPKLTRDIKRRIDNKIRKQQSNKPKAQKQASKAAIKLPPKELTENNPLPQTKIKKSGGYNVLPSSGLTYEMPASSIAAEEEETTATNLEILSKKITDLSKERNESYVEVKQAQEEYERLEEELDKTSGKKEEESEKKESSASKLKVLARKIYDLHTKRTELYVQLKKTQDEYEKLGGEKWGIEDENNNAEDIANLDSEKNSEKPGFIASNKEDNKPTPVIKPKLEDVNQKPGTPKNPELTKVVESVSSLDELRDQYLKAKRLRGNVFRGAMGRIFGRTISGEKQMFDAFGDHAKMDFGGKEGASDLEQVRKEYQGELSKYRALELAKFEGKLTAGLSLEERNAQMQGKILELLNEEQENINERSVEGIEKNFFEKMKTKWRQHPWTRIGIGLLLGVSAAATAGTAVGAGLAATRVAMGGVGTYVAVEAGLEKTKWLGHKGLANEVEKDGNKEPLSITKTLDDQIRKIPDEEIRKEAARLKMLQVEKGIAIENAGPNKEIVLAILRRDNELTAAEAIKNTSAEKNPTLNFANLLSNNLAGQIDAGNKLVESEIDKERIKKMARKTIGAVAGVGMGWLVGGGSKWLIGKIFHGPTEVVPSNPIGGEAVEHLPNHVVTHGENVWKIVEHNLDAHHSMDGLSEGARTHMIDALKDKFAAMSPDELKNIGITSGDVNVLRVGDSLNLSSILDNHELVTKALLNARHLSPAALKEIVSNNHEIASWFAAHHQELRTPLNSAMIDDILHHTHNVLPGSEHIINHAQEATLNHVPTEAGHVGSDIPAAPTSDAIDKARSADIATRAARAKVMALAEAAEKSHHGVHATLEATQGGAFKSMTAYLSQKIDGVSVGDYKINYVLKHLDKFPKGTKDFIENLEKSGVKPKMGGFLRRAETFGHFAERATTTVSH